MDTKRLAGMIGIAAVVTLGVVGVDRWNKDAKARANAEVVQVTPKEPAPSPVPAVRDSYQVDPGVPQLPPLPKESDAPPLVSTGELEKQLKKSIDNLQKVLPPLPSVEESSLPPPEAPPIKSNEDDKSLPVPLPPLPLSVDSKDPVKPAPPINDTLPRIDPAKLPSPEASSIPAPPPNDPLTKVANPAFKSPDVPPLPAPQSFAEKSNVTPSSSVSPPIPGEANRQPSNEFQQRLNDLEMKYLKLTVAEIERRLEELPKNVTDYAVLEADRKRMNERIAQLVKAAPEPFDGPTDNVWALHLETVDGKTIVQAIVHQKARFKIVCERLDLQAPLGTLRAVGNVQISGEGFKGQCDRLSIALNRDHLMLEGKAEVGIRTRPLPAIQERNLDLPPGVEPGRVEEPTSAAVPILHLSGDHLELRWSDLQPKAPHDARADDPRNPIIRASAGRMVTAFNSSRDEQWSAWGTLRRTAMQKDGRPMYVLEDRQGKPLVYVHTPAGMSLAEHIGKRVSVFGLPTREEGRPTFTASHVAWE